MRKISLLIAILCVFYNGQTQQVTKEFNRLLVDDDFTRIEGKWSQLSNADNLFLATTGGFETWRRNEKTGFFIFPDKAQECSVFEMQVTFTFSSKGSSNQSAGLVMQAQADGSGALSIEINRKKQLRIRRAYANQFFPIGATGDGWIKVKKILPNGQNRILVKTYDKIYDIYVNGEYIKSFTEIEYSKGNIGLFVGPASKVVFNQLTIKTDDDHASQETSTTPIDEQKALNQVIIKLKETINKKEKRIAELEAQVRTQPVAGSKSDTGMQRQLGEAMRKSAMLESQLAVLKSENEQLKATVARLEGFKKTITESENGDVIINLTTLNQRLKDQIELLQANLRNAEKQNVTLTAEKAEVQRKLTASITENERLTNENLELKVKAIEKDSAIASLLERLEKSEAELKDCSKKVKKSKKKVSDEIEEPKKPKKKKRTDDVPLFDE